MTKTQSHDLVYDMLMEDGFDKKLTPVQREYVADAFNRVVSANPEDAKVYYSMATAIVAYYKQVFGI